MKRVMIVRHGESEWNASRLLQGQADIALSPRGVAQAGALIPTLAQLAPDKIVSSDLKRARHTAELLGYPEALPSAALREIDVGEWTGQPIEALKREALEAWQGWRAGTHTPPGGESWAAFSDRVNAGVRGALADCERLLVVCHGGVIRALLEAMIALPPSRIIPVGPASLTILAQRQAENGAMRLELFNFSPLGPILDAPD